MKKAYPYGLIVTLLFVSICGQAHAGTFMLGVKTWIAYWESGIVDYLDKSLETEMEEWGFEYESDIDLGTGFMAGPLLGWQSANGLFSISFAPMIVSSFSQGFDATITDPGTDVSIDVDTDVEITRQDYDLAIAFALSPYEDGSSPLEYLKLYAGYKYQTIDIDYSWDVEGYKGSDELNYTMQMPTVGIGFLYPLSDKLYLGAIGGIGWAMFSSDITAEDTIAFNAEVTFSYVPMENLIIQAGLRYQQWTLKFENMGGSYQDMTIGPTLSCVYNF